MRYAPGQVIARQGEAADSFYLVRTRTVRAGAGVLLDGVEIERAVQFRDAFDHRAGRAFGGDARRSERGIDFVGFAALEGMPALARARSQLRSAMATLLILQVTNRR